MKDLYEAKLRVEETVCGGVMLGRAIFGNPWLFSERKDISIQEKLKVLVEHTQLFEELLGKYKNFAVMKKHFKAYVKDFDGAGDLRAKLMETTDTGGVSRVVEKYLKAI